ncbi:MAG: hypothetical protein JWQ49_3837 [Edaphobacter sp.]|nr:hypothetical protein [Edaphobacter sp.]
MFLVFVHPGVSMLAFFQATQLNLFERFLTQAVAGINSTNITSGMQQVAYVVLLVGFLWQVYQSTLQGGDVRGLGTNLIKYVVTAVVVMNYGAVFTTVNQGFVNAGNWISNASGAGNLFQNWSNDLQTQFNQVGFQKLWGLVTADLPGLLDALLILVAYVLYPFVIAIFGFFYIFYGSILYIFGPIVIALMPLGPTSRLAKSYIEHVFIWNAWPILYASFGALLSAIQMGQIGQMLNQNNFLGGLGNLEGSFLIGVASIIFSLAIAVIPFIAKRIVSGDVGATAGTLLGATATALTAGVAAAEGAAAGAAAAGGGTSAGSASEGAKSAVGQSGFAKPTSTASTNRPASPQRGSESTSMQGGNTPSDNQAPGKTTGQGPTSSDGKSPGIQSGIGAASDGSSDSEMGSSPTLMGDAHAQQIRDDLQSVGANTGRPSSPTASQTSTSSGTQGSNRSSGNRGSGPSRSGDRSSAPRASRYNIASWSAYHAARLATQGVVSGGNTLGEAGSKAMSAVKDPVKTAGAIGGAAGKAAASVANAASNASRVARTVGDAVSHPGQTAQKGTQAVTGAVTGALDQAASTVKASVSAVKSGFSRGYDQSRRDKDRKA